MQEVPGTLTEHQCLYCLCTGSPGRSLREVVRNYSASALLSKGGKRCRRAEDLTGQRQNAEWISGLACGIDLESFLCFRSECPGDTQSELLGTLVWRVCLTS